MPLADGCIVRPGQDSPCAGGQTALEAEPVIGHLGKPIWTSTASKRDDIDDHDHERRYEASHEPKAAADYAAAHLAGHRLYSIDTWGGYLAGRFPTGRVVFLYDETGVFGTAALQRYLDIHDLSPDWAALIRQEGIADAIVPAGAQEAAALETLGWAVDCRDSVSGSVVMSSTTTPGGGSRLDTAPVCA